MNRILRIAVAGSVLGFNHSACAASLPADFNGSWTSDTTISICDRDPRGGVTMTVEPGAIGYGETRCRVISAEKARISRGRGRIDIQFDMACSGDGTSWRNREIWHLQTIADRKFVTTTTVRQWDVRDGKGRIMHDEPSRVGTTIYLDCK
jgi:hypothetical protein